MPHEIMLRSKNDKLLFVRSLAVRIARVSPDFLTLCEQEGFVQPETMTGGGKGYDDQAIRQLSLIRRLHQELDLDLETIDLVLHMRRQIIELQKQIDEIEQRSRIREQELIDEIRELRQQQSIESI